MLPCTTTRENRWLIFRVFSTDCSSLVSSVSIRNLFTKYDTGFASEFKWKETFVHRKTDLAWTMGKISAETAMTKISVWKTSWKPSWKDWLGMGITTFPDNNYHEFKFISRRNFVLLLNILIFFLLHKVLPDMYIYKYCCFTPCFLYSRTECIMKYGAVRKFYHTCPRLWNTTSKSLAPY